jgi:hypothetical protein
MKKLTLTIVCAMAMTGAAFAQGYVNWAPNSPDVTFETNSLVYSPLFGGGNAPAYINGAVAAAGLTATTASGFYYELLTQAYSGSPSTDTTVWDGTWTGAAGIGGLNMTGVNGTGLPTHAGWVTAGTVNGASGASVQVNWASGITQSVVLVGWSANLGSSWVTVSNILGQLSVGNQAPLLAADPSGTQAFFGETTIGSINPTAAAPGDTIFYSSSAPLATGNPIFSLNTQLYLLPVPEPATMALAGLGGLGLLLFRRRRQ